MLDGWFGDAELVDAVADDLAGSGHCIGGFVRGELGQVDFHHQVNTTLEVKTQIDGTLVQVVQGRRRILLHGCFFLLAHSIELNTGIQIVGSGEGEGHDQ